jgi:hypothetical protein
VDSEDVLTSPAEVCTVVSDLRSTVPGAFEQAMSVVRAAAPRTPDARVRLRYSMVSILPATL